MGMKSFVSVTKAGHMYKVTIHFRGSGGELRTIAMSIDSIEDMLSNISEQQGFADYITENTGINVTSPILAVIK